MWKIKLIGSMPELFIITKSYNYIIVIFYLYAVEFQILKGSNPRWWRKQWHLMLLEISSKSFHHCSYISKLLDNLVIDRFSMKWLSSESFFENFIIKFKESCFQNRWIRKKIDLNILAIFVYIIQLIFFYLPA